MQIILGSWRVSCQNQRFEGLHRDSGLVEQGSSTQLRTGARTAAPTFCRNPFSFGWWSDWCVRSITCTTSTRTSTLSSRLGSNPNKEKEVCSTYKLLVNPSDLKCTRHQRENPVYLRQHRDFYNCMYLTRFPHGQSHCRVDDPGWR